MKQIVELRPGRELLDVGVARVAQLDSSRSISLAVFACQHRPLVPAILDVEPFQAVS